MRAAAVSFTIAFLITTCTPAAAQNAKELEILYELAKMTAGGILGWGIGRGLDTVLPAATPVPPTPIELPPRPIETTTPAVPFGGLKPIDLGAFRRRPLSLTSPSPLRLSVFFANLPCSPAENDRASYSSGERFYYGNTELLVKKDFGNAADCFRVGAHRGFPASERFLGYMYLHGEGVSRNEAQFFKLTHDAAVKGDAWARFNLGSAYCYGYGTLKNLDRCAYWLERSKEAGNQSAAKFLSTLHELGWNP